MENEGSPTFATKLIGALNLREFATENRTVESPEAEIHEEERNLYDRQETSVMKCFQIGEFLTIN